MLRKTFILIVALVGNISVEGQSTFESSETNDLNCAVEIHDTAMNEIRYLQKQLGACVRDLEVWPRDCEDIRKNVGQNVSDVYEISVLGSGFIPNEMSVYCDMNSSDASWLVFQRRKDGSEKFLRTWIEYKNGFGNPRGEFWLGNKALHLLTSSRNYKLRIDLEDFQGNRRHAEYEEFSVGPASDKYRLTVSGYSGDAGDDMARHNGHIFSTIDNDENGCAKVFRGAWWYNRCHNANLNGVYLRGNHTSYGDGVNWLSFRGHKYSLKMTEMKIAPRN